jgi:hypothetical protein
MSRRRRLAVLVLSAFVLVCVVMSVRPWSWHGTLLTPGTTPTTATKAVTFECGPVWGSDYVTGPSHLLYPVNGTPCAERGMYRVLGVVNVALGLIGIALAVVVGRIALFKRPFKVPHPSRTSALTLPKTDL